MTAPTPLARTGTSGASPAQAESRAWENPPLRPTALVLLACALVTAALTGAAVALAPASVRAPLAWGCGAASLALSAAVALAFHTLRANSLLREHVTDARQDADRIAREQAARAEEFTRERTALTEYFARERTELTVRARTAESERAAALAACANAAGRMQALATGMLADLREMEGRHADEDVLTDLLHLDHRTAQAGRIADSVAVLTGARSGRRWARPIVMESILRGAMGRIGGYQRVRVHSASEVAVAGHAAEGVMHALAELLDNAANFSPPTSEVHVYIEEVAAGVIISVEDSGLVMGPVQQRRAEHAVSGETKGLGGLSGTRLGLAVVGRLARKHGLTVSFRPSARGGTGVLLLIPQELISRPSETAPPQAQALPQPQARALPQPRTTPPASTPAPLPGPADLASATGTPHSTPDSTESPAPAPARPAAPADSAAPGEPPPPGSFPAAAAPENTPDAGTSPATPGTVIPEAPLDRVDRDPVPTHESPAGTPDAATHDAAESAPLPKRPRGRTLAAAERARADSDTGETRIRPRAAADTAARFSSFRQAVRATPPASSGPEATDVPATPPHPEGDTPR
ncbi:ATP-binding protein [Streptomyces sp. NPDC041068]|uniref:ATP-binding protein n=1 Tax=Streptomyces sp. NPDC041068 TaxID=3155130 RepID=UPI0033D9618A